MNIPIGTLLRGLNFTDVVIWPAHRSKICTYYSEGDQTEEREEMKKLNQVFNSVRGVVLHFLVGGFDGKFQTSFMGSKNLDGSE